MIRAGMVGVMHLYGARQANSARCGMVGIMPESVISIPVWDHTDKQHQFTRNIVNQILGSTLGDFLLVVTDNASPHHETKRFLDSVSHPRLKVVRYDQNEGVSRGYNTGFHIGYALGAQYFVAMNNDIIVNAPDWLERLIAPIRENKKLIVGPRRIANNLNVDRDGYRFDYLEGFMMGFHREFLDIAGVFDEQFSPAYCEDCEICWRGIELGFFLREVDVPVDHVYGQTGYISVPDTERIMTTLSNVQKLHRKVATHNVSRVWYEGNLFEQIPRN